MQVMKVGMFKSEYVGIRELIDGGEVVNLTHWLPFIPKKIPSTNFC
jgi:hypothetical protein